MKPFKLSIVTPVRDVVDTQVISLIAPGIQGYFGVLYGHAPLIGQLQPGFLMYRDPDYTKHFIAIQGGFLEIRPDQVRVLADEATRSTQIDKKEAERSLEAARRTLRGEDTSMTVEQATIELEHATAKLLTLRVRELQGLFDSSSL